jgi:hypothetical protein
MSESLVCIFQVSIYGYCPLPPSAEARRNNWEISGCHTRFQLNAKYLTPIRSQ